jgi:hypothetical protein
MRGPVSAAPKPHDPAAGPKESDADVEPGNDAPFAYEDETSETRVVGTVATVPSAHLRGEITLSRFQPGVVWVTIARLSLRPTESNEMRQQLAGLLLPIAELDALDVLVRGMIAHARRDAVVPTAPSAAPPHPTQLSPDSHR